MRRASVLLAAAALILAGLAAPSAAFAADPPRLVVSREDPLMTETVTLTVTAVAPSGSAVAFSGTAVLSTGKAAVSVPMRAAKDASATVRMPTAALRSGWAALTLRARVAGRAVTASLPYFAELAPSFSVRGFGCASVTPAGGTLHWAVDRMDGVPVTTPLSRDVPLLPYVGSSAPRWSMTSADGRPLTTSGTLVVRDAAGRSAKQVLPKQVRRLVFGTAWNGRLAGAFRPGTAIATLTLQDASGRTSTAAQPVQLVAKGTGPCGA